MDAFHRKSFGRCPKKDISGTGQHSNLKLFAIFFNETSVLTNITDSFNTDDTNTAMAGKEFPAGSWYFGEVTAIKLASGDATGYWDTDPAVDEEDIAS